MLRALFPRIEHIFLAMTEGLSWPAKIFAVIIAFFTPLHALVGLMIFFLMADTVSAVFLDYKLKKEFIRKEPKPEHPITRKFKNLRILWSVISTDKMEKTTEKLFAYPLIGLVCFMFDRLVLEVEPEAFGSLLNMSVTNTIFGFVCTTDLISFLRNMGNATGLNIVKAVEKLLAAKGRSIHTKHIADEKDNS